MSPYISVSYIREAARQLPFTMLGLRQKEHKAISNIPQTAVPSTTVQQDRALVPGEYFPLEELLLSAPNRVELTGLCVTDTHLWISHSHGSSP